MKLYSVPLLIISFLIYFNFCLHGVRNFDVHVHCSNFTACLQFEPNRSTSTKHVDRVNPGNAIFLEHALIPL